MNITKIEIVSFDLEELQIGIVATLEDGTRAPAHYFPFLTLPKTIARAPLDGKGPGLSYYLAGAPCQEKNKNKAQAAHAKFLKLFQDILGSLQAKDLTTLVFEDKVGIREITVTV